MDNPVVLMILFFAAVIFGTLLLRYIMRRLAHGSADAIGNAWRSRKNATSGPTVERLADMYPAIAQWHVANGTAYPATGAVNPAGAPAVPVAAIPAAAMYPAGFPQMQAMPVVDKAARRKKVLGTIAMVVAFLGALINLYILVTGRAYFWRGASSYDNREDYRLCELRLLVFLAAISFAAYVILFNTKRLAYTFFCPVLYVVIAVCLYVTTDRYVEEYREMRRKIGGRTSVPRAFEHALSMCLVLIALAAVLLIVCLLCLLTKALLWKWLAPVLGIACMVVAAYAFSEAVGVDFYALVAVGNFFGYPLLLLLYGLANREKKIKKQ